MHRLLKRHQELTQELRRETDPARRARVLRQRYWVARDLARIEYSQKSKEVRHALT